MFYAMKILVEKQPEDIKPKDLAEIFKLFCIAYDINYEGRDIEYMETVGHANLNGVLYHLDYRKFNEARFCGKRHSNGTEFWKEPEQNNDEEKQRIQQFSESVSTYFNSKQRDLSNNL